MHFWYNIYRFSGGNPLLVEDYRTMPGVMLRFFEHLRSAEAVERLERQRAREQQQREAIARMKARRH